MTKAFFNRDALECIHKECLDLGQRKSADYGQNGDAIAMAGPRGVVTRMLDKQMRLLSLTQADYCAQVTNESLRDTAMDMINYATYLVALLDGTWGHPAQKQPDQVEKALNVVYKLEVAMRNGDLRVERGTPLHNEIVDAATEELPF